MTLRAKPLSLAFATALALSAPAFAGGARNASFDADNTVAGQRVAPSPGDSMSPSSSTYGQPSAGSASSVGAMGSTSADGAWSSGNMSAGPVYGGTAGEVTTIAPNVITPNAPNPAFDSDDQVAGRSPQQPAVVDGRLWGNPAFDSDDTVHGSAVPLSPSRNVLPR